MTTVGVSDAQADDVGPGVTDAPEDVEENRALRGGMVKSLVAVLANVGVLTALLVYFGWVRSERMAS